MGPNARMESNGDAIRQSEKLAALGSLLAGIAHELNNPLSVVAAQALLMKDTVTDPKLIDRATKIANAADRCSRIVRTFLAMARQQPLERAAVSINDIVTAVMDVTRHSLATSGIELTVELAEDVPPVCGNVDELNQVVTNLIVNAQQAISSGNHVGHLRIVTAFDHQADRVLLSVADNGPGIPDGVLPKIFDAFFTTKSSDEGTGIGLAVCRRITESMHGSIDVTSHAGQGTTFTIALPPSDGNGNVVGETARDLVDIPSCKVLLIENESEVALMIQEILSLDGHDVRVAATGERALQLLARYEFDLILTELRMPGIDGFRLFELISELSPRLRQRMAFITGDSFNPLTSGFLRRAGRPYLEKPFSPNQVRTLISEILSHVRLYELLN